MELKKTGDLNLRQIFSLNRGKNNIEYKKEKNKDDIDLRKIEVDNMVKSAELDSKALESEIKVKKLELKNEEAEDSIADVKNFRNYKKQLNNIKMKEIPNILKSSKSLGFYSLICSLFSAVMTNTTIYKDNSLDNEKKIIAIIAILTIGYLSNIAMKNINRFCNDFYEEKSFVKLLIIIGLLAGTIIYTGYSVVTNYQFWDETNLDICGKCIISVMFDLFGVVFALLSDEYFYINFNKKKMQKISRKDNMFYTEDKPSKRK